MTEIQPGCGTCAHLHQNRLTCSAFPDGIPLLIQSGQFDHREKWAGDRGVRWELDPKLAAALDRAATGG